MVKKDLRCNLLYRINMKEEVYKYLTTIPKGKVVTYGQIAEYLGSELPLN